MRKQGPPQPSQFAMHLGDYKKVDGIMLPHKIDISIDGQPNEEWTIEKFKVNPSVKADEFNKPKGSRSPIPADRRVRSDRAISSDSTDTRISD